MQVEEPTRDASWLSKPGTLLVGVYESYKDGSIFLVDGEFGGIVRGHDIRKVMVFEVFRLSPRNKAPQMHQRRLVPSPENPKRSVLGEAGTFVDSQVYTARWTKNRGWYILIHPAVQYGRKRQLQHFELEPYTPSVSLLSYSE